MGVDHHLDDGADRKSVESGLPRTLAHDPEMEGLTLYEKKCVLINREIDSHGFGRYQTYIWLLCGFGYLLDLLWAQAFGLVLGPIQQEFGFPSSQSGNISIAFSSGLTAGAFVWGLLVDIIGRQWAFNLTCFISAAFGLGLGGCETYTAFLVVTAFIGFGIGGNIPIDTTICLEFIPQNKRFMLALLSVFQPIGVALCSIFAYAYFSQAKFVCQPDYTQKDFLKSCKVTAPGEPCCGRANNMAWRYLMFTLGAITLGVFFLRYVVFRFKESPKFLVYRGRDDKAVEVLQYIAKFNKQETSITLETFESLTQEHESINSGTELLGSGPKQLQLTLAKKIKLELIRYTLLFKGWTISRLTILVWLTYICDYWGFTLAGGYIPIIVARKNAALDLSLSDTYKSYIYIYLPGIAGVALGALMYRVPRVGRKWTMVFSSAMMGVSIFVFSSVNNRAGNIGLNVMEYFFQSMFNAVLYGWTPEVFPAPIRGTACGLASFWGRLFGIIAPIAANGLVPASEVGAISLATAIKILYLAGGMTLGCVLWTSLLPANSKLAKQSM